MDTKKSVEDETKRLAYFVIFMSIFVTMLFGLVPMIWWQQKHGDTCHHIAHIAAAFIVAVIVFDYLEHSKKPKQ